MKLTVDDLASKLDAQKQTLAAVKLQAQTLDDNYPALHHELGEQIENLSSGIVLLRLILIGVGAAALLGIIISFFALDRARALGSRKMNLQGGGRKQETQAQNEEPLRLIIARIYQLEQELSRLQEQLITGERPPTGDEILTGNADQENVQPDPGKTQE